MKIQSIKVFNNISPMIIVVLSVGILLRLYHLGYHSLWLDEIWHVTISSLNWQQMINEIVKDAHHPPLDMILLHLMINTFHSKTEWLVRFLPFIWGSVSIVLFYYLVTEWTSKKHAFLAMIMFAFSPMAISYSQEARMYSLLLFLVLLSLVIYMKLIKKMTWTNGVLLGVVNAIMILTQYYSTIVIFAEGTILLVMAIRKKEVSYITYFAISLVVTAILCGAWIPFLIQQMQYWKSDSLWHGLKPNLHFFKIIFSSYSSNTGIRDVWFYLYGILFLIGVIASWKNRSKPIIISAVVIAAILGMLFMLSIFKTVVTPRHVIFLLPLYLTVTSYGLLKIYEKTRINIYVGSILLGLVLAMPVYKYHFDLREAYKPNWKEAAQYLNDNKAEDEKIAITDIHSRVCLANYLLPQSTDITFADDKWKNTDNSAGTAIWIIDDKIIDQLEKKQWGGWVVISSNSFGNKTHADKLREVLAGQEEKEIKTRGNVLAIYRVKKR